MATGERTLWQMPGDADWYQTNLGTPRFAVLDAGDDLTFAIIDLEEGWVGVVQRIHRL